MQLFYNPNLNLDTRQFSFDKEESKHIVKVLRKSVGDTLHITNGNGFLFKAEIVMADIRNCVVTIISNELQKKHPYQLHLAVAPTKMNDRFEWFLEKATEIGIDTITPIICEHSERKVINTERFEKILQSAAKQSLSCYLPKLNSAVTFNDFVKQDFSIKEIELAIKNRFIPVTLGDTRLRTETAAIVACHSVAFINEIV